MADDLTSPASLYDRDFVAWTEQQAQALRARRNGLNALDYDRLAEEIEDLGKSEQRTCRSYVERIIEHLLKLQYIDSPQDRPHWKGELLAFRDSLEDDLTPTIRNRLQGEMPRLYARQVERLHRSERISDQAAALATSAAYSWDQVVDRDWHPSLTAD